MQHPVLHPARDLIGRLEQTVIADDQGPLSHAALAAPGQMKIAVHE